MNIIESSKADFESIASAHNLVRWQEESQFASQALAKNPTLAQCAEKSIRDSIINVAAIGLTLNPAHGYAYLVPESVKIGSNYTKICQLRVSFKGLIKLSTDGGVIDFVRAELVHENDEFIYNGPCDKPKHNMNPFSDRGDVVGVYCIAKTNSGDWLADVMSKEEIDKCKNAAKTKSVWDAWFGEMAKKAIIKRAAKMWPCGQSDSHLAKAIRVLNEIEGGEKIEIDVTPEKKAIAKQKQTLTNERLNAGIERIKSGEYSLELLYENFELTPHQVQLINEKMAVTND